MDIGICKLCGFEKELLRRSHIISECNYDGLYDNENFLHRLDFSGVRKNKAISKIPKGEYEGNILCSNCDSVIIQSYEDYVCRMIYAKRPLSSNQHPICTNHVNPEGQEFTFYRNIDYQKAKLYFLSILWRASISSRPFFNLIEVSDHEREKLREMVYSGTPGNSQQFPVLTYGWLNDVSANKDLILQPKKFIAQHSSRFCFPIRGFVFNVYMDIRDVPLDLKDFLLADDCFPMLHLQRGDYMRWIDNYNALGERD